MVRDPRLYDSISSTYGVTRREDRRVAGQIHDALGSAERIINVGAGTGNYEPRDRPVVAVEPSIEMISKRPPGTGAVVRAVAEALPFRSESFDAAMATLTLHHWQNRRQGLTEMRRVAPRQVIFLFDPAETYRFWAIDYWPTALALPSLHTDAWNAHRQGVGQVHHFGLVFVDPVRAFTDPPGVIGVNP